MSATITFKCFTGATASGSWTDIAGQAGFVNFKAVGLANDITTNIIVPAGAKATFNADWFIDATADTRIRDRINDTWSTGAGVANRCMKILYSNTTNGSFTGVTLTVWGASNETGRNGVTDYAQSNNQWQAARVGSQAASGGTYTIGSGWTFARYAASTTLTLAQGVAGTAGLDDEAHAVFQMRIKINSSSQAGDDISPFLTTRYSWT